MGLHQRVTHPSYVEGCFTCKVSTVSMATVPGGARDQRTGISRVNQREKDLHRYREKRRAGEQPEGTTKKAMDAYDRRVGAWEKAEAKLSADNSPDTVSKLRNTTFNAPRVLN